MIGEKSREVLFSHKEWRGYITGRKMNVTEDCPVKQNNPDAERQTSNFLSHTEPTF